jgi:hypothetical protein
MKRLCLITIALFAPAAGATYKCTDEKGLTYFGDTPPAQCAGVPMYELSPSGLVLRRIEPTPTPEQVKAKATEAERNRAEKRASDDQKRKDEALLNTYSAEREFDVVRDRNIGPITGRIASARERIKAVETRQKELEDEMEFYKAGKATKGAGGKPREAPPMLSAELQRMTAEKQTLERSIVTHEKDIEDLHVKFDNDKKRWIALKGGAIAPGTPLPPAAAKPAAATKSADASAEKAPAKKP